MPVEVTFRCGGCSAEAKGTAPIRKGFQSLSGRDYGIGSYVYLNTVEDVVPAGWTAYDRFGTDATYCPTCTNELEGKGQ